MDTNARIFGDSWRLVGQRGELDVHRKAVLHDRNQAMSFALSRLQRRQAGKPIHPDTAKADVWPLVAAAAFV